MYTHENDWNQNMINSRMIMRIHTAINTSCMYMHIYTDLKAYIHAKLIYPYLHSDIHTKTPLHQWDTSERHAGIFLTRQRKRHAQTWPARSCAEFQNGRY